ncbi:MAG TPA: MSMEG_0570 family nitrogen starvation response protein [Marmoricola sp.]|jgi:uncharacterized repeat protein (TIGR04042 family)|nr:MSMEG_0570 family nitrogen starvation response protein [Marmoricola sp.]
MSVVVRWPDGTEHDCYSPSLVMHDYLAVGEDYTVADFVERTTTALDEASARVQARFGFACTSAAASIAVVRRTAATFSPQESVRVLRMHPPLPQAAHEESA